MIITSSSDEKLEQAKKLGADFTVNYRKTPDWQKYVMDVSKGHGADIILETGGTQTILRSFESAAYGGLINCIGYTSGKTCTAGDQPNVNVLTLSKTLTLKGIINGPTDRFEEMVAFYEKHKIHPVVNRVFPFDEAKDGLKFLESGAHFGKVVIQVKN